MYMLHMYMYMLYVVVVRLHVIGHRNQQTLLIMMRVAAVIFHTRFIIQVHTRRRRALPSAARHRVAVTNEFIICIETSNILKSIVRGYGRLRPVWFESEKNIFF